MKFRILFLFMITSNLAGCYYSNTLPVDDTLHLKNGIEGKWLQSSKVKDTDMRFYLEIKAIANSSFYDVHAVNVDDLVSMKVVSTKEKLRTAIQNANKTYFIGYVTTIGEREYLSLQKFDKRPKNIEKALGWKRRRMAFVYKIEIDGNRLALSGISNNFLEKAIKNKQVNIDRSGCGPSTIEITADNLHKLIAESDGTAFNEKALFNRF